MAALADFPGTASLRTRLGAVLRATGWFLGEIFTAGPRVAALQRLSETPDEALAARGTTRDAQIRRILGPMSAL